MLSTRLPSPLGHQPFRPYLLGRGFSELSYQFVAGHMAELAIPGAVNPVSMVIRIALVQLATPNKMRGRVGAINYLLVITSYRLGGLDSGITAALLWMKLFPAVRGCGAFGISQFRTSLTASISTDRHEASSVYISRISQKKPKRRNRSGSPVHYYGAKARSGAASDNAKFSLSAAVPWPG